MALEIDLRGKRALVTGGAVRIGAVAQPLVGYGQLGKLDPGQFDLRLGDGILEALGRHLEQRLALAHRLAHVVDVDLLDPAGDLEVDDADSCFVLDDLAGPIDVLVTPGHLARIALVDAPQRPATLHLFEELAGRHNLVEPPAIAITDVHELDQPHNMPAAAKMLEQIEHGMIVDAALHGHVDFDRLEAGR